MNRPEDTAVAILNWNGLKHLQTYLPSVVAGSAGDATVYVIDNGSTDESQAWTEANHPDVKWVQLEKNLGFAGGYNAGLAQIHSLTQPQTYILLNSDVRVSPGWIPPVLQAMAQHDFTACAPLLLNDTDPDLFEYAGAAGGHMDKDGFMFCAGRIFEVFESNTGQYNNTHEVFWGSGAALFIRAEAWHAVGGLDVDFFAHMEEIDLCWRLKNRGHRVGVCGDSTVYHLGGGTLQKISPFKTYLNFRNNLFLLTKNEHKRLLIPMLTRRMILDGIAALKFLTEGSWGLFRAVFRAHMSFYASFRKMQTKRSREKFAIASAAFPGPAPAYNDAGRYNRSILVDYFWHSRVTFDELPEDAFVKSTPTRVN